MRDVASRHLSELRPAGGAGLRSAGESTKRPVAPPTRRELNDYLYVRDNEWGFHREWWFCRVCEEWFLAERHTYTNEVRRTWHPTAAGEALPAAQEVPVKPV